MKSSTSQVKIELQKNKQEPSNEIKTIDKLLQEETKDEKKVATDKEISKEISYEQALETFQKTISYLESYINKAQKRLDESKKSDPLTQKKIYFATVLQGDLIDIKQELSEELYTDPQSALKSLMFFLLTSIKEHQNMLKDTIKNTNNEYLWERLSNVVDYCLQKPLQFASVYLYHGKLGNTLDDLNKSLVVEFPEQAQDAIKAIYSMNIEDAKQKLFPEFIQDIESYIKDSEPNKKDQITAQKIQIAIELKTELEKLLKNTELEHLVFINLATKCILRSQDKNSCISGSVLMITNGKKYIGETIANFLNFGLSWISKQIHHGKLGKKLDSFSETLKKQIPQTSGTSTTTNKLTNL